MEWNGKGLQGMREETARSFADQIERTARTLRRGYGGAVAPDLGQARARVLLELRRAGEPLTPTALAAEVGVLRSGITGMLRRLEAADLVRRRSDRADKRSVSVELTASGRRVSDTLAARERRFFRELAMAVSASDARHGAAALAALEARTAALGPEDIRAPSPASAPRPTPQRSVEPPDATRRSTTRRGVGNGR